MDDGRDGRRRSIVHVVVAALAVVACTLFARTATAHTMGLSSGRYVAHGAEVAIDISFARGEITSQCPDLDRDHDTVISPVELSKNPDCLHFAQSLFVRADGAPCTAGPVDAELSESDGVTMHVRYTCPAQPARVEVDDAWLLKFPTNHRHVARAEGTETRDRLLDAKDHRFEIAPAPADSVIESRAPQKAGAAQKGGATEKPLSFFALGVEHILLGFDHLVFLFGLLLVPSGEGRKRIRALVLAVTAFSVGHSLSLALAVSEVVVPSTRIVEPLIAASIAFVGLENVTRKVLPRRWLVTLPFGFIHGFGFAAALRGILPTGIGLPLLTFNLGVEVGQLLALLPMLGFLFVLDLLGLAPPKATRAVSFLIFLFGAVLCVVRIVAP